MHELGYPPRTTKLISIFTIQLKTAKTEIGDSQAKSGHNPRLFQRRTRDKKRSCGRPQALSTFGNWSTIPNHLEARQLECPALPLFRLRKIQPQYLNQL